MRFGSFLLGGIVGAAAVVYFNNKSKSMLFSAFSSNNQTAGMADKAKDRFSSVANTAASAMDGKAANKSAANAAFKKDGAIAESTSMSKVEEIINKDPDLKVTVDEILSHNRQKETFQTQ